MSIDIKNKIISEKIITVLRGAEGETCLNLVKALFSGGIRIVEVTFNGEDSDALSKTADTIKMLNENFGDEMLIGAGTVTSLEKLNIAKFAGAEFIVSPNVDQNVIKAAKAAGIVSISGAFTATEALSAYNYGADFIKLFPAFCTGAQYLKAIKSPLANIPFFAFGGINEENVKDFLNAGAVGVGVCDCLVKQEYIKSGDFEKITNQAKKFKKIVFDN